MRRDTTSTRDFLRTLDVLLGLSALAFGLAAPEATVEFARRFAYAAPRAAAVILIGTLWAQRHGGSERASGSGAPCVRVDTGVSQKGGLA